MSLKETPIGAGKPRARGVFLTGSAGYIGQEFTPRLAEKVDHIVASYRKTLPEPHKNILPVCSDLGNVDLILNSLRDIDTIVHLAWESPRNNSKMEQNNSEVSTKSNLQCLERLLEAGERASCRRFVFVSAVAADPASTSSYLSSKYAAERLVLASKIPERGILRCPIIFGGDHYRDRALRSVLNLMRLPLIYPIPDKSKKLAYAHLHDIVGVLLNLALREFPAPVGVVQLANVEQIAPSYLFEKIAERFSDRKKIGIPGSVGQLLTRLIEAKRGPLQSTPDISAILENGTIESCSVDENNPFRNFLPTTCLGIEDFFGKPKELRIESLVNQRMGILS